MKYFIAFLLVPSFCFASSLDDAKDTANTFLKNLPEYSCFREVWTVKAELPWEIGGIRYDHAHMLIRKSEKGILFAQPVPDCQKRESCGYWIRSFTYESSFIHGKLEKTECPKKLNKKAMINLIKTEYKESIKLD
jgi:hypothetical protein